MKKILIYLLITVLIYVIALVYFLPTLYGEIAATIAFIAIFLHLFPLHRDSNGHRTYPVPNLGAAKSLLHVLEPSGLRFLFSFESGGTTQIVLSDWMSVIMIYDETVPIDLRLPGLSIASSDPVGAANYATQYFTDKGYVTEKVNEIMPQKMRDQNKLFVIKSNLMPHNLLIIRKPIIALMKDMKNVRFKL